jgi:hypothetical protein
MKFLRSLLEGASYKSMRSHPTWWQVDPESGEHPRDNIPKTDEDLIQFYFTKNFQDPLAALGPDFVDEDKLGRYFRGKDVYVPNYIMFRINRFLRRHPEKREDPETKQWITNFVIRNGTTFDIWARTPHGQHEIEMIKTGNNPLRKAFEKL